MNAIKKSASKIVFLLVALTTCIAFLFGVVTHKVLLETKDFLPLVAMVFTYYTTRKGYESSKDTVQSTPVDDRGM